MSATKMFSARLPDSTLDAIEARARRGKMSKSEALAGMVSDALDMRGRDGLETRLAAAKDVIAEQERMLNKQGKTTPRSKRLGVSMSVHEAAQIERAAHAAGMSRGDYMRARLLGDDAGKTRTLPGASRALPAERPALPAGK